MIHITQLIYLREGKEEIFDQFEAAAIPRIKHYNGQLLLRIRPDTKSLVEGTMELPYEVHLVSFPSSDDFDNFMKDETRKEYLHLKEASVKSVQMIVGK